eukprot:Plantae.Rhodophyta-Palmaria_palmata.ctg9201.p1 GENE.Plantae.Rhodophyta-Palmaria_palmata.ctg9201~~Plantae.Rhodophyta-Palmaria_palmata.ctg9201.p1  ORF type:complete len:136 (+),score=0.89 Plantae.Rhodophyta-Palmaria_palmata.ctg9201:161-568(+)
MESEPCAGSMPAEDTGRNRSDGPGPQLRWSAEHQANIFKPFVRHIDWRMDSCAATNKRQCCFGGIGFMLACSVLDVTRILFMLPGHTKFGPDLVARAIAGEYNKKDVFNQAMIVECAEGYSSVQVYDQSNMLHWK